MALSVINPENAAEAAACIDWAKVQFTQFEHDEKYHREICRLSTQDRLRHMALHFAKYAGRLHEGPEDKLYKQIAVDSMIIAVSCANIMNIDLSSMLRIPLTPDSTRLAFARHLSIAAGKMAAACEKLDHLEDYPFRRTLMTETLTILTECIAVFISEGWEPVREMAGRLAQIKAKSIFHGKL